MAAQTPVHFLCDNVLRLVFRACADRSTRSDLARRDYSFVRIARVCKQWHRVLMTDPVLFCVIGERSSPPTMAQLLVLSRDTPISVHFPLARSSEQLLEYASFLGPHMGRVRNLRAVMSGKWWGADAIVRSLKRLFDVTPLAQLERLDLYAKVTYQIPPLVTTSLFTQSVPRLRYLKLHTTLVGWASPLFAGRSLRSVHVHEEEAMETPTCSVDTVRAALRGMPLLESLTICARGGFLPADGSETAPYPQLMLPHLSLLDLNLPPRDATLLTAYIAALAIQMLRVEVRMSFDRAHELRLDAFAAALDPHVARVSAAHALIHLHLRGAAPAYGLFDMWINLRPASPVLDEEDMLPLAISFDVGPDLQGDLHAGIRRGRDYADVDVRALAGTWAHAELVAFWADETLLPALTWRELLGGQSLIAAAELWTDSCLTFLEALRDDASFLPALARLRVRRRSAYLEDERLLPALCSTFGPRAPRAPLEELELELQEDNKIGELEPKHLERLRECATRVVAFSRWGRRRRGDSPRVPLGL
jgi:hypothetical protein